MTNERVDVLAAGDLVTRADGCVGTVKWIYPRGSQQSPLVVADWRWDSSKPNGAVWQEGVPMERVQRVGGEA